jgi:hypothetical protein
MKHLLDEQALYAVELPLKTQSYTPVPHIVLTDILSEALDKRNLDVQKKRFTANDNGQQMFSVWEVGSPENGQYMNIGFRNSYDKSLAVGLCAGSTVIVCSNLMFKGDIKVMRKHTNGVFKELKDIVNTVVESAEVQFLNIVKDVEEMKLRPMDRRQMAELAGRMFIEDGILTSTQLSILKNEVYFSEHFKEATQWDFYNHCTEALKTCTPKQLMQKHIQLHNYILQV